MKEKRETKAKKAEKKRNSKSFKLRKANEIRRNGKAGHFHDDQRRLNALCMIIYHPQVVPSRCQKCVYWKRNDDIPGEDILEAFKNILDGRLTKVFESYRGSSEALTKINVTERINNIKFDHMKH